MEIMKSIPFTDLPEEIRKEYNYDPVKAAAIEKEQKELEKQRLKRRKPKRRKRRRKLN